jgi:hypothetical protein
VWVLALRFDDRKIFSLSKLLCEFTEFFVIKLSQV